MESTVGFSVKEKKKNLPKKKKKTDSSRLLAQGHLVPPVTLAFHPVSLPFSCVPPQASAFGHFWRKMLD